VQFAAQVLNAGLGPFQETLTNSLFYGQAERRSQSRDEEERVRPEKNKTKHSIAGV
jgi:hypothetical protein